MFHKMPISFEFGIVVVKHSLAYQNNQLTLELGTKFIHLKSHIID